MARYADVSELASFLRVNDPAEDVELAALLDSASRVVDTFCGWTFDAEAGAATARVFAASDPTCLDVDPIGSTTGFVLATDSSGNGTFDTTWTSSDYQLEPLNQRRSGLSDHPYTLIRAVGSYGFPCSGEARVQVTAQWGWTSGVPEPVRLATILTAKHAHEERNTLSGIAFGEGVSAYTGAMTPRVKQMLMPYRRVKVV